MSKKTNINGMVKSMESNKEKNNHIVFHPIIHVCATTVLNCLSAGCVELKDIYIYVYQGGHFPVFLFKKIKISRR